MPVWGKLKEKLVNSNHYYFHTGNGVLLCGDSSEVIEEIPEESIDLTITSPPYDDLRYYSATNKRGLKKDWNFEKFERLAKELYRTTKQGRMVIWIVGDTTKDFCESLTSFKQAIYFVEGSGFNLLDTMIYCKNQYPPPYPSLKRYGNKFEYMFVFCKGRPEVFNPIMVDKKAIAKKASKFAFRQPDGSLKRKYIYNTSPKKIRSNVWVYSVGGNSTKDKIAFQHPAIFPEQLVHDHIVSWSNKNDVVLDPLMGSGTVAKQCEMLGRRWIGIEVSEEYCEIVKKRLSCVRRPLPKI